MGFYQVTAEMVPIYADLCRSMKRMPLPIVPEGGDLTHLSAEHKIEIEAEIVPPPLWKSGNQPFDHHKGFTP
jgi:hypothetical protein